MKDEQIAKLKKKTHYEEPHMACCRTCLHSYVGSDYCNQQRYCAVEPKLEHDVHNEGICDLFL